MFAALRSHLRQQRTNRRARIEIEQLPECVARDLDIDRGASSRQAWAGIYGRGFA